MQTTESLKTFQIQRTCVYDGPGINTTLFFKGCNLRCLWCQNPEMQSFQGVMASDCNYSIDDIMEVVSRDIDYFRSTNGGVTLSGGEPLLQDPNSLIDLLKLLKKENIKITAETSLHAPWKNISKIAPYIDLFLVDLKIVGDDKLHIKYTKQDSTLIHSNIKKLIDLNANIRFRMVMVPGFTDNESNIQRTSDFLKSINYDSIELMKYQNLYEEKAQRLGLNVVSLNITPEQSLESLKNGVKLFNSYGIKAENTDLDSSRHQTVFTQRVKEIQKDIRESRLALCIEAAKLKTKYYKKHGFKKPTPIHRAERLSYVLRNKKVIIYPRELLVGNFTSKRTAGQLWEEYAGTSAIMFLYKINRQKPVSFQISRKDRLYFYFHLYPFWSKHSLLKKIYPKLSKFIFYLGRTSEMDSGFNNNLVSIAHFIANFEPILNLGTSGLIEEIRAKQKKKPENNQDFYNGTIIALKGLESFALKYAEKLSSLSKKEKDPERRRELEEMERICRHVPMYPARTFHEALQCILFIQIALCLECFENAISYGRLDQILYTYYKKDKEAGLITYEKAKELLCLFILKMDEVFFINDGNSFLNLYKNFETLSTDQALTFGGVDKEGKDATNDITYMLIDACELQPRCIDMAARVHKNSPVQYLERIAEGYINGCPIPQLFSDEIYIETIQRHYPTTLEHARNYAIIGCVEPNASDDHFGNTDCANMNLALPFLQALRGHEHDLWNYEFRLGLLQLIKNFNKYLYSYKKNIISRYINTVFNKIIKRRNIKKGLYIYNPPSSMDELLERFQTRLNHLANSILTDHQKIEKELCKNFTTPLASSLFDGCIESGKDVYEGGTTINSSGIQALGVTDVADSLHAINEVVFKKKLYSINDIINAIEKNFQGDYNQNIRSALLAVPKFGDDSSRAATEWVSKVMEIYNNALDSVKNCPRNGRYSAGYYALNVCTSYGKNTPALPSGRLKGVPLANSVIPHYGMEQSDLFSALNSIAGVNFTDHAENGTTVTFTIDSSLFQGKEGVKNLASIIKTFLTKGGMELQPNVINREILLDAYKNPEKHPYLLVRIAGYCAYFNELSDEMKQIIINRTCYS
ncbi:MAG: radical SAM protein [Promethearchaeota archaeon]|nr:MAG: radical SAM protein [Candidatus Lokiarchaeota archaeon]